MNKLAAKALKAQMMGDMETYENLNKQLEAFKASQQQQPQQQQHKRQHQKQHDFAQEKDEKGNNVVVLPEFDLQGRKIAATSSSAEDASSSSIKELARRMKETGRGEDAAERMSIMRQNKMSNDTEDDFDKVRDTMFNEDDALIMIIAAVPEELVGPLLEGFQPFFEAHSGVVFVHDIQVGRPIKFRN